MDTLLLKLLLTPALIGGASLAGRRWGHAVSGWLVGLPLTSGPVAFFLALERGTSFAAATAIGSLAGALAEAAFCIAYAAVAARVSWPLALVLASLAFAVAAVAFPQAALSVGVAGAGACASFVIALSLIPRRDARAAPPTLPRWDLPARMVVATVLVYAITELAPALGPRWSGVLATFPVYAAILTVFAHRTSVDSAVNVLLGLFAFAAFFVVLALLIDRAGVALAFAGATAAALAVQAGSFAVAVRSAPARA